MPTNTTTGAQAIVESLQKQGVEYIFGYSGGAAMPIFDALLDSPIKFILARHEQGATHEADGYARATGKAGVVLMARIAGAKLVPVGYAASRAWVMNTWDRFMVPAPFAKIVITIGVPIDPPRGASMEEIEAARDTIQGAMDAVIQASKDAVADTT